MRYCSLPVAGSARHTRLVAIAALLGATLLAGPPIATRAATAAAVPVQFAQATAPQTPAPPPAQATPQTQAAPQGQAAASAGEEKAETVEQRITSLHAALQITAQEEAKWDRVAKVMRENAANMEKLVADKNAKAAEDMTALEDLQTYEKFAEAHVAGLRKLTASFATLYNSMPAAQKKVADEVFQNFGHKPAASHS